MNWNQRTRAAAVDAELLAGPIRQTGVGVVASFDFDRDRELWRWAPDAVSLYMARTEPAPMDDGLEMVTALNRPHVVGNPTRTVAAIGSDVVLYACTACSFVGGAAGERALRQAMLDAGAPRAQTTSGAVVQALRAVEAQNVAILHPYGAPVARRLRDFLVEAGFTVPACNGTGGIVGDYATVADFARRADHPDADALFISCTALPTYDLIAPLENELGKPVVTANQAGVWSALGTLGLRAVGTGQSLLDAGARGPVSSNVSVREDHRTRRAER